MPSDRDWDFDIWRIAGLGAFVLAVVFSFKIFDLAAAIDAAQLVMPAGLVGGFMTMGTFLFGQADKNDQTITIQKDSQYNHDDNR